MKSTSESTLIYIPRAGCRSGYDDSTVGVTHKHDWTVHRTEEAFGDGNVIIKRGEWQLRGHNIKLEAQVAQSGVAFGTAPEHPVIFAIRLRNGKVVD